MYLYIYIYIYHKPFWQDPRFFFSGKPPGRGDLSDVAVHGTMSEPAEVAESDKASQEASRWGEDGGFHQVSWEACPGIMWTYL